LEKGRGNIPNLLQGSRLLLTEATFCEEDSAAVTFEDVVASNSWGSSEEDCEANERLEHVEG
jgi:hypothetical protein